MKFFFLAHNPISLYCLKELIRKKQIPEFTVIHKDLEYEKLKDVFYDPINYFCKQNNIKLYSITKLEEIKENISGTDFGMCVGFMQIIRKEIFELPEKGIYNLHCGKLPEYRGRAPISRAIINGDRYITVTVHKIDEGVDSGDICLEENIIIKKSDDVNTLYKKCSAISALMISEFVRKISMGNISLRKQNLLDSKKSNLKITESERKINWNHSENRIFNLIRALTSPYPNAFSIYNDEKYYFNKASIIGKKEKNNFKTGVIIQINKDSLIIKCRNGCIKVSEIKNAGNEQIIINKTFLNKGLFK